MRCGLCAIFDVAIDIHRGRTTYRKRVGFKLSVENGARLCIEACFAHEFATLEPDSEIVYKCSDYYAHEIEGALRRVDPDIVIEWPIIGRAILSEKNANTPLLVDLFGRL